jgi:hypothetical protein
MNFHDNFWDGNFSLDEVNFAKVDIEWTSIAWNNANEKVNWCMNMMPCDEFPMDGDIMVQME